MNYDKFNVAIQGLDIKQGDPFAVVVSSGGSIRGRYLGIGFDGVYIGEFENTSQDPHYERVKTVVVMDAIVAIARLKKY
jgi:hypothetical protein